MKVVLQRVTRASVDVDGRTVGSIDLGFMLLVGIGRDDGEEELVWMARKIAGLRVFNDSDGNMNLGLKDVGGAILAISQFTLYGDARKGKRPSFIAAARPESASALFDRFVALLRDEGIHTETGVFGAKMAVDLLNDGPVTLIIER